MKVASLAFLVACIAVVVAETTVVNKTTVVTEKRTFQKDVKLGNKKVVSATIPSRTLNQVPPSQYAYQPRNEYLYQTAPATTTVYQSTSQADVVKATLDTSGGVARYTCPPNYELRGDQCYHIDCQFEQQSGTLAASMIQPQSYSSYQVELIEPQLAVSSTPRVCVIPATIREQQTLSCPLGTTLISGVCVYNQEQVMCPQGTIKQNDQCVFYVQRPATVYVDFYCPANTVKDVTNRKCIYTPMVSMVGVQCPDGFVQVGNVCYFTPPASEIRCPDGSLPQGGFCILEPKSIELICPENSRYIGNFICELSPIFPKMVCADGSAPFGNTCGALERSSSLNVTFECPNNGVLRNGVCYAKAVMQYPVPKVSYECPSGFKLRGDTCEMELAEERAQVKFICPDGSYLEGDHCVFYVDNPVNYKYEVNCPPNTYKSDNKCVYYPSAEFGTCEKIVETTQCCAKKRHRTGCQSGPTIIHNNNTVYIPTNITSVNINTINIGPSSSSCSSGGSKKSCSESRHNIDYERDFNGTRFEHEHHNRTEKCCTVVTPRICENRNGHWECGHRRYERCGPFCTQDEIHLKASHTMYRQRILSMPPPTYGMRVNRVAAPVVNCYGCVNGRYDCSPECFEYDCEEEGCEFVDQNEFCGSYGGAGCGYVFDGYYR